MPFSSIQRFPRVPLAQTPTPVARVESPWPDVGFYVKRDDLTGNALSGNKARKLEYLVADAQRQGADTLLTCGGVQSNCARALSVAAAMTGFDSALILTGQEPAQLEGNLLVARMMGSQITFLPAADAAQRDAAQRDAALAQHAEDLLAKGRRPYLVPFGGSSAMGVLGYVRAAEEVVHQLAGALDSPAQVVMPMASGGTYAGLYIGFALAGVPIRPVGAFVEGTANDWVPRLVRLIHEAAELLGVAVAAEPHDIELLDARGMGYAKPTQAELESTVRFARRTGLVLDPVYTGKAFHTLDLSIRSGTFEPRGDIIFLHTGGTMGLFPHAAACTRTLSRMEQPAKHHGPTSTPAFARPAAPLPAGPLPAAQRINIASP